MAAILTSFIVADMTFALGTTCHEGIQPEGAVGDTKAPIAILPEGG
jgi:hypothetical protein